MNEDRYRKDLDALINKGDQLFMQSSMNAFLQSLRVPPKSRSGIRQRRSSRHFRRSKMNISFGTLRLRI